MAITNSLLSNVAAPIYTSTGTNAIVVAYFCNTSADPTMFSLYVVPSGANVSAQNTIYANVSLTSSDTYVMDVEKIILDDGDAIWAQASQSDVVATTIVNIGV